MDPQTYVVTGASKGLGRALALALASDGHPVFALARPSTELDGIGELLASLAPGSRSIECDLSDPTSIATAACLISEQTTFVAGLVHNAGAIAPVKPMDKVDASDWARSIQVNLVGVQDLTQRIYSLLGGEQQSRITVISSGASMRPIGSWSAYCVSKAGLDMWSRCMAEEGRANNISSISIAPGVVDTSMQKEIRSVPSEDFPSLKTFIDLHENGHLASSETVASQLFPLVTGHTMEQSGLRFDVREL
ncbi:SDR family NAD(P)-dependent oxidoreductase [Candidatus Poseidoniaceae archaeon]|nr:SDR family NAD(P)-dependent oxidoreductase [Candidatus Poseidoniaceae archaeon]